MTEKNRYPENLSTDSGDFKFFLPVRVHYADTDAQQVVYYGAYSRFFEAARQEYWRRMGVKLQEVHQKGNYLSIVEFVNKYYQPAFYDDVLDVYVRTPEIRERSFDLDYLVVRRRDSMVIVAARTIFVFVKHEDWKATGIPAWFRTAVEQYEDK